MYVWWGDFRKENIDIFISSIDKMRKKEKEICIQYARLRLQGCSAPRIFSPQIAASFPDLVSPL
jgi:hypothetical protein